MPIHYDEEFAKDEPSFDLGWSIDPEGAAGDTLDDVVVTINSMQDRVDGGIKSQIAQVQTAINLLQNRFRTDLQKRIDAPSVSLIELQEKIAVDSAGRIADISERFNGFISMIAGNDGAFNRCRERCRQTYLLCREQPDNQDLEGRIECEMLLWECVKSCRLGDDPGTDPPTGPGGFPPSLGIRIPSPGIPSFELPPPGIPGRPNVPFPPGKPDIMPPGPEEPIPDIWPPGPEGAEVPPDLEIDSGGYTSDKRVCLMPDMSGIRVDQVGGVDFYIDDRTSPFPPPGTSDGIGAAVWEIFPYSDSSSMSDKDLWISVLVPCDEGESGCMRHTDGRWYVASIYKAKCQPVLLPMEPVYPGPQPGPDGVCCPPPNYSCRLFFDCVNLTVYGLLVTEGTAALPRNKDDIAIGSSGITQGQFEGMIRACREFDPDEPDMVKPSIPPVVGQVSFCLDLTAGSVIQNIMRDPGTLCSMLGFTRDSAGNLQDPPWIMQINYPWRLIAQAAIQPIKHICQWLIDNVQAWLTLIDCLGPGMMEIVGTRIVLSVVSLITGRALSNWDLALEQQGNFKCPVQVPSETDAIVSYLGDTINLDIAKCWVQANNFNWEDYQHVMRASRSKLGVNELIQLHLRGEVDAATLDARIRMLGFIDQGEPAELLELSKWIPGPQDLIRWMVRDVEDQAIVDEFGLDDDFTSKYGGQVEKYSEWQNIDKQDMVRYWRAHWTIPGPHALYEMYHRLRYDHIPVGERVSKDAIKTALKQQDIAPYWVDRLLAVSFHPLTRVDVRRAYRIGSIDRPQVEQAYKELGYSDANSTILGDFAEQQVKNTWIKSPLIGRYVKGEINAGELGEMARQEGALPGLIPEMLNRGDLLRAADTRGKCLASLRKRFLEAEFTTVEALNEVSLLGVDLTVSTSIVSGWECELQSAGKHAPASTLCTWWKDGIIDSAEFFARLLNLGYENDMALNFLAQCEISHNRKIATAERQRMKQIAAEARRLGKEAEKQAKQVERDRKRREAAADKMRKTRGRREDILVEAAKRLANRLDEDIVLTMREVKATNASMKSLMTWTEAVIVQSISQAAQVKEIANLSEFSGITLQILSERPVEELSGNGNGNGSS